MRRQPQQPQPQPQPQPFSPPHKRATGRRSTELAQPYPRYEQPPVDWPRLSKVPTGGRSIAKRVVKIVVVCAVLLTAMVAAGAGYVYYTGRNSPVPAPASVPSSPPPAQPFMKPTPPSENVPASVATQSMTPVVAPGGTAELTIRTVPTAVCSIGLSYNSQPVTNPAFVNQTADPYGIVMWRWQVDSTAPRGTWPTQVKCTYRDRSAMGGANLVIQ